MSQSNIRVSTIACAFFFAALAAPAHAMSLEGGAVFANMIRTTSSNEANPSLFGTPQTLIGLSFSIFSLRPEVDYTLLSRSDSGKTYDSKLLIVSLPYATGEAGRLQWKLGPSAWIQMLSGGGGNVTLQNGTGTATFSKPGRSVSTRTFGILAGATIPLANTIALDCDFHVLSPLSSRRSYNLIAQLAWSFL